MGQPRSKIERTNFGWKFEADSVILMVEKG